MTTSSEHLQEMADEIGVHLSAGNFDALVASMAAAIAARVVSVSNCAAALADALITERNTLISQLTVTATMDGSEAQLASTTAELHAKIATRDSGTIAIVAYNGP